MMASQSKLRTIVKKLPVFLLLGGTAAYAAVIFISSAGIQPDKGCKEIIVADCISIPTNGPGIEIVHYSKAGAAAVESFRPVEVEIVHSLKRNVRSGRRIIGASYPMVPGRRYLLYLYVFDDEGAGPEAYAGMHYHVAELPASMSSGELAGKSLRDQISLLYRQSLARAAGLTAVPDGNKL